MRHRARILRELSVSQNTHVINTLNSAGRLVAEHIGREFLFSKDSEAFLQRQLEPISAGHTVAGPVVEVFVSDDGFDIGKVLVGGNVLISQNIFGIENVQAYVFHGAEVKVIGCDNHEAI